MMPWCHSPYFEDMLAGMSDRDIDLCRRFNRDGYVVLDSGIEDELLDEVSVIMAGLPPERQLDIWPRFEPIRLLACHENVLDVLAILYRREPIPFQTLNFARSPQQGVHTDMIHFNSWPHGYMCGVWVALEDITAESGPLFYYPGSHKLPFHTFDDVGLEVVYEHAEITRHFGVYSDWLQRYLDNSGLQRQTFCCKRGQMLVWAANLAHGSVPVLDQASTRMSQVSHYYFADCMYYVPAFSRLPLGLVHYKRVVDLRSGSIVPHKYFGRFELCGDAHGPQATSSSTQYL